MLDSRPSPQMPIAPAEETRRAGVGLLRVDCRAGGGGELGAFYERNGFTPTEPFLADGWPGQVLARRIR